MPRPQTILSNVLLVIALSSPAVAFGYINAGFRSQAAYDRYLAEQRNERGKQRQRLAEQLAVIDAAILRDPNDMTALYQRGRFFQDHNEFDKAMADFNAVIERDPQFARAYFRRSFLWVQRMRGQPDFRRTLSDLNEAIRLEPTFVPGHFHRAVLLFVCPDHKLRNLTDARESAKIACDLARKVRTTWNANEAPVTRYAEIAYHEHYCGLLGAIAAEMGDFDTAIDCETQPSQFPGGILPHSLAVHERRISVYQKRQCDPESKRSADCFLLRSFQ